MFVSEIRQLDGMNDEIADRIIFFIKKIEPNREKLFLHLCAHAMEDNNCWIWMGGKNESGYGITNKKKYGFRLAHQAAFCLYYDHPIVHPHKHICHSCNNRACINPLHLYEGTPKDNAADLMTKRALQAREAV